MAARRGRDGHGGSGDLVFYQRCGFRPHHVERDVFTRERGYDPEQLREPNGLTHLDMLWLDVVL